MAQTYRPGLMIAALLLGSTGAGASEAPTIIRGTDAITDEPFVQVRQYAKTDRSVLVIQCKHNTTSAGVEFAAKGGLLNVFIDALKGAFPQTIDYRVDGKEPVRGVEWVSFAKDAVGFKVGAKAIPFARQMHAGRSLLVRRDPGQTSERDILFDLSKLRPAIEQVAAACNWKIKGSTSFPKPKSKREADGVLSTLQELGQQTLEPEKTFAERLEEALQGGRPPRPAAKPVTAADMDRLRRHFQKCWRLPSGVNEWGEATVLVTFDEGGKVTKAEIQGNPNDDLAKSALRAVRDPICNTFPNPPPAFVGVDLQLNFSPRW